MLRKDKVAICNIISDLNFANMQRTEKDIAVKTLKRIISDDSYIYRVMDELQQNEDYVELQAISDYARAAIKNDKGE